MSDNKLDPSIDEPTAFNVVRAVPLGGVIFGAVSVVYWRRGVPSRSCGAGAEAVTIRVLAALLNVARASDLAVMESDAADATRSAISDHVETLGLSQAEADALRDTLTRVVDGAILSYSSLEAAAAAAAEAAGPDTLH